MLRSSLLCGLLACLASTTSLASSHREAPFITELPKVDGSDFYLFRSYENGREGYVTLIANYLPLQDAYGGPNYFTLDPDAVYEIHIDNDGDAIEDLTFRFDLELSFNPASLDIGGEQITVPLINIGPIGPAATDTLNASLQESFSLTMIRGDRRTGSATSAQNSATGMSRFVKSLIRLQTMSLIASSSFVTLVTIMYQGSELSTIRRWGEG